MPWVKIDEEFYDHPKWASAPGDSIALWLAAMAWCNRNDSTEGFIPAVKLRGLVNIRNVGKTTIDLTARDAFHPEEREGVHGYLIHDYVEYQQPEKVRQIAAKRAAAGMKGATARWGNSDHPSKANGMATPMANAIAHECPVSRLPSPVLPKGLRDVSLGTSASNGDGRDDDLEHVLATITEARMAAVAGIRNRRAYRTAVLSEARLQDGELATRMLADGTPPDHVAMFILGHGIGAEAEHDVTPDAWCTTDCPHCHGDHWIDDGTDRPAPCPNGPRAQQHAAP